MRVKTALKKPAAADWHWSDVLARLHKAGWSLRQLAFENNYTDGNTLGEAKRRPFPKGERIIAQAIGLKPETIWPSRYNEHGEPNRRRGPAPRRPGAAPDHCNTPANQRNTQSRKAA